MCWENFLEQFKWMTDSESDTVESCTVWWPGNLWSDQIEKTPNGLGTSNECTTQGYPQEYSKRKPMAQNQFRNWENDSRGNWQSRPLHRRDSGHCNREARVETSCKVTPSVTASCLTMALRFSWITNSSENFSDNRNYRAKRNKMKGFWAALFSLWQCIFVF